MLEGPVRVAVCAPDPVTEAGLTAHMRVEENMILVPWTDCGDADVLVLSTGPFADDTRVLLQRLAASVPKPVVLVIDEITEAELVAAVSCKVVAVLPRVATTGQ